MKTAILWLMCLIVVAASALVITDKVLGLVSPRSGPEPAPPHAGAPNASQDGAVSARLERVEKSLDAVRQVLQIPEPDATESREDGGPPPQAGIGERLQWIESELNDLRRQSNRDLMQIFIRLRRRLDEMEAALVKEGAPDTRATVADLKKLGVDYQPDRGLIAMEAAFVQPTRVLEFVAVGSGGNAYEALLVVNAKASALKRALEMMGVSEAPDPPFDPAQLTKGSGVYVYVTWAARKTPIRIEKLIRNTTTGKTLAPTPFVFTASRSFIDPRTWDEHLAADIHKNVIALTWNYASDCVLSCPDPAAESHHVWMPDTELVPAPPTPATIFVTRDPQAEWDQS